MRNKESGSTLALSMIVIVVMVSLVAGALDYTMSNLHQQQNALARSQAVSSAVGALDLAYIRWRQACRLQENLLLTATAITASAAGWGAPDYGNISGTNSYSFLKASSGTNAVSVSLAPLDSTDGDGIVKAINMLGSSGTNLPTPNCAQSIRMPCYSYLCRATASYTSLSGNLTGANRTQSVSLYRIFKKTTEAPWNYAIFYNDDLEINPGATMNVTGAVKTNANLYAGGGGGTPNTNNLTFSGSVHYAGRWNTSGWYAPTDTTRGSTIPLPPAGNQPTYEQAQAPQNSAMLGVTNSTPGTSNGYHELIDPPPSGLPDPLAATTSNGVIYPSERLYNQAGIKILVTGASRSSPTVTFYDGGGTALTGNTNTQTTTQVNLYNALKNSVTTTQTLQDNREGSVEYLTQVDMSKVTGAVTKGQVDPYTTPNVVYVADLTTDSSKASTAVELINGYKMPTGGITLVSPNPVYVMGDYNTASSANSSSNVPSNQLPSNPLQPNVTGYSPQPSAIMADAITVLSNAWTNANSTSSTRIATATTVNAAFLSGNVVSGSGYVYSGGVENFPRFLEDWSGGVTFTYYGSMVELFHSQKATGVWGSSNVYNPPKRQWYFNVSYYQSPPPGTFTVINYSKSRMFVQ